MSRERGQVRNTKREQIARIFVGGDTHKELTGNRKRVQELWVERSLFDRLRIFAGVAVAVILGFALLASTVPAAAILMLGATILTTAFLLLRKLGINKRVGAVLFKIALVGAGLTLMLVIGSNSLILAIAAAVAIVGFPYLRDLRRQRQEHERRMLPNQREVIQLSVPAAEHTSELNFQSILHTLSRRANKQTLTAADRRDTRGVISTVLIADRPDPHGQVRLSAFLEGHEETDRAERLETLVQNSFAGRVMVTPVDPDTYPPFQYAEQWRRSQSSTD